MQLTYSFRVYPTTAQENKLLDWLDLCRRLYNIALKERQTVWKKEQRTIGYNDQQNNLPAFKKVHPEYKAVHSQVLQDVLRRVDTAYQNFFSRRAGYPRFKGRGDYSSITYPQVDTVNRTFSRLEEGFIYLSKIGYVKIRIHREADLSTARRINVKIKNSQWYVNITCEVRERNPNLLLQKSIGIDMGLSSFVATSDGQLIDNPRHLKKKEKHLKRIQRQLSRKQKGSKNRLKAKNKLSKAHLKVANQRKDFLHKTSNTLVQQYNIIIAEDLQVKNMTKNHCLAKSIHDAGWSRFLSYLEYKAKKHGKRFIQVPSNNTSQLCICGADVPKDLSVRVHTCPKCGYTDNRDVVSAKVIESRGLRLLSAA
ncbi:MAG: transposase [Firmicutes bacterium HGW-Firmicutes-14]|nr:MAG: transposase [Firmicutes bacterium HGW-Firmicutes-14]